MFFEMSGFVFWFVVGLLIGIGLSIPVFVAVLHKATRRPVSFETYSVRDVREIADVLTTLGDGDRQ